MSTVSVTLRWILLGVILVVVLECLQGWREHELNKISRRPGTAPEEPVRLDERIKTKPPLVESPEQIYWRTVARFSPPAPDKPRSGVISSISDPIKLTDFEINRRYNPWECGYLWGEDSNYYAVSDESTSGACFFSNGFVRAWTPFSVPNAWFAARAVAQLTSYEYDRVLFGHSDVVQTPSETLHRGKGDCEDLSLLLASWLRGMNLDARIVSGTVDGEGHRWVVLYDGEQTYLLEATESRPSRIPPHAELQARYHAQMMFDAENIWLPTRANPGNKYKLEFWQRMGAFTPFASEVDTALEQLRLHRSTQTRSEVSDILLKLAKKYPEVTPVAEAQAELWIEQEKFLHAHELISGLVRLLPKNKDLRFLEVNLLLKLERRKEALAKLQPLLTDPAISKEWLYFAAVELQTAGDPAAARGYALRFIEKAPHQFSGYLLLAQLYEELHQSKEQRRVLETCLKRATDNAAVCRSLLDAISR